MRKTDDLDPCLLYEALRSATLLKETRERVCIVVYYMVKITWAILVKYS